MTTRTDQLSYVASNSGSPEFCTVGWQYLTAVEMAARGRTFEQAKAEVLAFLRAEHDRWAKAIERVEAMGPGDLDVPPYDPAWDAE